MRDIVFNKLVSMHRMSDKQQLRKCLHSHSKTAIFFQYFVGTSDILLVQIACLSAYMYQQISKCTDKNSDKALWGGGGIAPCLPPLVIATGDNQCTHPTPDPLTSPICPFKSTALWTRP